MLVLHLTHWSAPSDLKWYDQNSSNSLHPCIKTFLLLNMTTITHFIGKSAHTPHSGVTSQKLTSHLYYAKDCARSHYDPSGTHKKYYTTFRREVTKTHYTQLLRQWLCSNQLRSFWQSYTTTPIPPFPASSDVTSFNLTTHYYYARVELEPSTAFLVFTNNTYTKAHYPPLLDQGLCS